MASPRMRGDCVTFASHWQAHNHRILTETGPLWVVLGDSTGQGLGAPSPEGGYVGQTLAELRLRTGLPWRVLNLSVSGALIRDVLNDQLPRLPAAADLLTCGIGVNDILYAPPAKLLRDLRALMGVIPDETVILDLPLPTGIWGILGRISVPYVAWINRTIHEMALRPRPAGRRGLRPFPAALGREVRIRLLPSQPGRVPRLDPRAARRHPGGGRLDLAPLVQDVPELAQRLLLVGSEVAGHHHLRAGPVRPGVLAAGLRTDQERGVDDLDVIPHLVPGNAGRHQADRRLLAIVIGKVVKHRPTPGEALVRPR